jgi:phytoene desaturase
LDVICKYFYEDHTNLVAYFDKEKLGREIEAKTKDSAASVLNFLKNSHKIYDLTADLFLHDKLGLNSIFNKKALKAFFNFRHLNLTSTMDGANRKAFKDPKLVQLFNRYATYNGSDPYRAPGILNIIPHLEYNKGAYFPEGGMYSIVKSLVKLAEDSGVKFHLSTKVDKINIQGGKATGITIDGEERKYDAVICNCDMVTAYERLLPDMKKPRILLNQPKSSSAIVFYWNINAVFEELELHNIFFSSDYKKEFSHIFDEGTVCSDPTIYINISSKNHCSDAPEGCENWFVMINVPSNSGQNWNQIVEDARTNILKKLSRILKQDISRLIAGEMVLDPLLIEKRTSSFAGALYGNSSNNKFAAFLRHANKSSKVGGLYFCGGSVHPGGGIPLCLLSAKITANQLKNDFS